MKEMGPILGIEGGGTKTSWVLLGPGGRRLAEGVERGSNLMLVGMEGLRKMLRGVAKKLPVAPRRIGAGFAGARGKPEIAMANRVLREVWPRAERVIVGQDTDSALAAAWGREDGFLVIAGTGSNVIGRKGGKRHAVGGHGHLLGFAGARGKPEIADHLGVAPVAAGGGRIPATGGHVGPGFCPRDLRVSRGVPAGGDCFVDERTGKVAEWVDGFGSNDDECGFGDRPRRLHGSGKGEAPPNGPGSGSGIGGKRGGGSGGDGAV